MYFQRERIKLRLLPYLPVGLGRLGGRSRSLLYCSERDRPPFFVGAFSLPLRAGPAFGRPLPLGLDPFVRVRPVRLYMYMYMFPARVPLGLDHLVFGRFTYRPMLVGSSLRPLPVWLISLRPSSLGSAGSLIGLRPRSLGVRPVHSSAFGPFQLPSDRPSSLGRFT